MINSATINLSLLIYFCAFFPLKLWKQHPWKVGLALQLLAWLILYDIKNKCCSQLQADQLQLQLAVPLVGKGKLFASFLLQRVVYVKHE